MKSVLDYQSQSTALPFWSVLIIALLVLLSPTAVWAHKCGPSELTVEKSNFVWYTLRGQNFVPSYEIVDNGDPLVATIESPTDIRNPYLIFKINGVGNGTTVFKIHWKGQNGQDTCSIKVTSG